MNYYLAPMESLTGYCFRNAYHKHFPAMDKYFTPFISPKHTRMMNTRETTDILPENNQGMVVVPQILTNKSELFLETAKELVSFGYKEVNLNLGCPSMTVVSKGKGSGMLKDVEQLTRFLDAIFEKATVEISIKTRIGIEDTQEFDQLLKVFNQFPIKEWIIHPRLQKEFYNGIPHKECFVEAVNKSSNPLCYNGDLTTKEEIKAMGEEFPTVHRCMIGRGILKNPGLLLEENLDASDFLLKLKEFHQDLYHAYQKEMSGEKPVLFKMKEFWFYFIHLFPENEKNYKKIKKAQRLSGYEQAVKEIFNSRFL